MFVGIACGLIRKVLAAWVISFWQTGGERDLLQAIQMMALQRSQRIQFENRL